VDIVLGFVHFVCLLEKPKKNTIVLLMVSSGDVINCVLAIALGIGSPASTLPQVFAFLRAKSTIGISLFMLMLGCLNNYTQFLNMLILNYPKLRSCATDVRRLQNKSQSLFFLAIMFTYMNEIFL